MKDALANAALGRCQTSQACGLARTEVQGRRGSSSNGFRDHLRTRFTPISRAERIVSKAKGSHNRPGALFTNYFPRRSEVAPFDPFQAEIPESFRLGASVDWISAFSPPDKSPEPLQTRLSRPDDEGHAVRLHRRPAGYRQKKHTPRAGRASVVTQSC